MALLIMHATHIWEILWEDWNMTKYAWVVPLKDKKRIAIANAFQTFFEKSSLKPNKLWADKSSECYNISMKSWWQDNDIKMCLAHNEEKSAVAERFVTTFKNIKKKANIFSKGYIPNWSEEVLFLVHQKKLVLNLVKERLYSA